MCKKTPKTISTTVTERLSFAFAAELTLCLVLHVECYC